jgi:hypothetical protein
VNTEEKIDKICNELFDMFTKIEIVHRAAMFVVYQEYMAQIKIIEEQTPDNNVNKKNELLAKVHEYLQRLMFTFIISEVYKHLKSIFTKDNIFITDQSMNAKTMKEELDVYIQSLDTFEISKMTKMPEKIIKDDKEILPFELKLLTYLSELNIKNLKERIVGITGTGQTNGIEDEYIENTFMTNSSETSALDEQYDDIQGEERQVATSEPEDAEMQNEKDFEDKYKFLLATLYYTVVKLNKDWSNVETIPIYIQEFLKTSKYNISFVENPKKALQEAFNSDIIELSQLENFTEVKESIDIAELVFEACKDLEIACPIFKVIEIKYKQTYAPAAETKNGNGERDFSPATPLHNGLLGARGGSQKRVHMTLAKYHQKYFPAYYRQYYVKRV